VFPITCNYSAQLHVGMLCVAVKKVGVLRDRECLSMKQYINPGGSGLGERDAQSFHKVLWRSGWLQA
jgi:hypothetical protein